jgi:hypothetical protein
VARPAKPRHIVGVNFRALACLLLAALPARAVDSPVPLREALARKTLAVTIRGNARDQLTIAVRNTAPEAAAIEIPAGLVCTGEAGSVVTLRSATLAVPAGQSAEAVLPVVARSVKNGCAEQSFAVAADAIPAVDPLLKYLATRNDFPKATAQLAALALLEDVTFAKWQEFLAPQRAADAGPAPLPAEIATAVDALGVLREIAPGSKFALASDDELKVRALRNPIARAKAMQLYGLALPEGLPAPNLQQLLHTKPGDNCPICRMRAQMQDAGNGL